MYLRPTSTLASLKSDFSKAHTNIHTHVFV